MIKRALTTFVVLLVLLNISCQERYPDLEDGIYAEFITTKGTMVAVLHYDKVPATIANFVALAEGNHPLVSEEFIGKRFYDSITFHRVINNFMIQGGDPTATGTGSAGFRFDDEFHPELKHDKPGILSMANGGPGSNGTQFFIMEKPWPSLDNKHAVFGQVVEGMDVHDSISNVKTIDPKARNNKPIEDVVITKLNIIRKGAEAKAFDAPKVVTEEFPLIKEKQASVKEEAQKAAKAKADLAKTEFLKKNETLNGRRIESPTGMAMIFTEENDGIKPKPTDKVNIDCAGYFEDGTLFWTTWKSIAEKNGKYDERQDKGGGYAPFAMPYNKTATLVAGFREAMLNMKVGDKARVFIPYYLGYGESGQPPVIPGSTNLVFDIEIPSIVE
ncbi:peptidylprolyl isomerase [Winogradskyella sp. UBA3174]|uniref:peptidylprolyl isomerase n=1 Tax=Winogradskyella sp. UBA3174 TaxID=1947785 RepID=UPI0025CDAB60|nr:peptidylprolyl isomerase [Winogradskyella sp. UBA3174]|tara:strand:+ start:10008 stop:11168 length:1161 start_codon:yes stop_codon:yes gene_type:complete